MGTSFALESTHVLCEGINSNGIGSYTWLADVIVSVEKCTHVLVKTPTAREVVTRWSLK